MDNVERYSKVAILLINRMLYIFGILRNLSLRWLQKLEINFAKDIANTCFLRIIRSRIMQGTVKFTYVIIIIWFKGWSKDENSSIVIIPKISNRCCSLIIQRPPKKTRVINLKLVYVKYKMKLFCTECTNVYDAEETVDVNTKCQGV